MEIALFGGSFDPPHVGHLLAVAYVLATEPIGELWLVPVNEHPFGKRLAAPFEHRATLCEAMIEGAGLRRAHVSRIEAEIGGEVRTVDLLEHLRTTRPSTPSPWCSDRTSPPSGRSGSDSNGSRSWPASSSSGGAVRGRKRRRASRGVLDPGPRASRLGKRCVPARSPRGASQDRRRGHLPRR